jgi:hypothetical protein
LTKSVAVVLLLLHGAMLGWRAIRDSPNIDELGHLAAGLRIWNAGRFDLYIVNPPLVKFIAAAPVIALSPRLDWSQLNRTADRREEWSIGEGFVAANQDRWRFYLTLARCALIPVSLFGGYACMCFAARLFGNSAGLLALALWCWDPGIHTWGATLNADCGAAAFGLMAAYAFWRWLDAPGMKTASIAGCALGLASLCKFTCLLLFLAWPAAWAVARCLHHAHAGAGVCERPHPRLPTAWQLASILMIGLYGINLGYAFEGSLRPIGGFTFSSELLGGSTSSRAPRAFGNRFAAGLIAALPVPLPANYLRGIDLQRVDHEAGRMVYLNGQWTRNGRWYYFLEGFLLKTPLGTVLIFLIALCAGLRRIAKRASGTRHQTADQAGGHAPQAQPRLASEGKTTGGPVMPGAHWLVLLIPVAALHLVLAINHEVAYLRYALPGLPFLFVAGASVMESRRPGQLVPSGWFGVPTAHLRRGAIVAAIVWSLCSSVSVFPHSLAYFNELAGGPLNAHRYYLGAELDWGNNVFHFENWYARHPELRPMHFHFSAALDLQWYGPDLGTRTAFASDASTADRAVPLRDAVGGSAWYAVSVNALHEPQNAQRWFTQRLEPRWVVGYGIYIYEVPRHVRGLH